MFGSIAGCRNIAETLPGKRVKVTEICPTQHTAYSRPAASQNRTNDNLNPSSWPGRVLISAVVLVLLSGVYMLITNHANLRI